MTAKWVLMRPRARAPTCLSPCYATGKNYVCFKASWHRKCFHKSALGHV